MIMALMSIFLVVVVAFVLETSHLFSQKARLSDGLEQAVLAVTTERDQFRPNALVGEQLEATNRNLVNSYVRSYIPNSQDLNFETHCYKKVDEEEKIVCGVQGQYRQNSLFPISIGNNHSAPHKAGEIIPKQVAVGSSAYAQQSTKEMDYHPQDLVIAISANSVMDATWTGSVSPGGDGSPICNEGAIYTDRDTYVANYREHCIRRNDRHYIDDDPQGLLVYSRMYYMDKILFAKEKKEWLPMVEYDKNASYDEYTGLIQRLFDSKQGDFKKYGQDRVRLMVSDFAYPDPKNYETKCVFPFQMKKVEGTGYYDWFYADPHYSDGPGAYNIDPIQESNFTKILTDNLSQFTYNPVHCTGIFQKKCRSSQWYRGLIFTSILHQYLDAEATAKSVFSFKGQPINYPKTTFDNTSRVPPEYSYLSPAPAYNPQGGPERTLTCFASITGPRSPADSGWVNVSLAENKPNNEGLTQIKKVFSEARPGTMQFLPTALMEAAQGSMLGGGQDKGHRKIIVLITGDKTQELFGWGACHPEYRNGLLVTVCDNISNPVDLREAYQNINSPEYHWWDQDENLPQALVRNGIYEQTPIRHVFTDFGYCNTEGTLFENYEKGWKKQTPTECRALGGRWVYSKAVAIPNPAVSVLSQEERKLLPWVYHKDAPGGDNLFNYHNRQTYVNAVFQRIQFELLVKNNICDNIRKHLYQETGEPPLIAVIFVSSHVSNEEIYWKHCVGEYLYHVTDPRDFKRVMKELLKHRTRTTQSGVLNVNVNEFNKIKGNQ